MQRGGFIISKMLENLMYDPEPFCIQLLWMVNTFQPLILLTEISHISAFVCFHLLPIVVPPFFIDNYALS